MEQEIEEQEVEQQQEEGASNNKMNMINKFEETATKRLWTFVKVELYCTFWLLSLENISVNKEGYKGQIESIKKVIQEKGGDKNKKEKEKNKELKDLESLSKRLEEEE